MTLLTDLMVLLSDRVVLEERRGVSVRGQVAHLVNDVFWRGRRMVRRRCYTHEFHHSIDKYLFFGWFGWYRWRTSNW